MKKFVCLSITAMIAAVSSVNVAPASNTACGVESRAAVSEFFKQLHQPSGQLNIGLGYWIELMRDNKKYRCNNKIEFKSGDQIRFHVVPDTDGYAYIVFKKTLSSGHVLFPESDVDQKENWLQHGHEYTIPIEAALQFDQSSGLDKVELFFSHTKVDPIATMKAMRPATTCFVAAQPHGAKDLIPAKMELGWEEPSPVIIAEGYNSAVNTEPKTISGEVKDRSFVTIISHEPSRVLAIEIALRHHP